MIQRLAVLLGDESERKAIIETYARRIGEILYGNKGFWDKVLGKNPSIIKELKYDANGYGVSYGNGTIAISPSFITDPTGNYSVDKILDTVTHETRHEYQSEVKKNPDKYAAPDNLVKEWKQKYITSTVDYNKYYGQDVERDARAFAALSRP